MRCLTRGIIGDSNRYICDFCGVGTDPFQVNSLPRDMVTVILERGSGPARITSLKSSLGLVKK